MIVVPLVMLAIVYAGIRAARWVATWLENKQKR